MRYATVEQSDLPVDHLKDGSLFVTPEKTLGSEKRPPVDIICFRQRIGPDHKDRKKLEGPETLNYYRVMQGVVPDGLRVLTRQGDMLTVKRTEEQILLDGSQKQMPFGKLHQTQGEKPSALTDFLRIICQPLNILNLNAVLHYPNTKIYAIPTDFCTVQK